MIELRALSKAYGGKVAVDALTVTVLPGRVTGLVGPNGSGKSTTMRLILGLDRPTAGEVLVNGGRYVRHPAPLQEVGALLDATSVHPNRSAHAHLLSLAATTGIPRQRVEEVLRIVGLSSVARQPAKTFSLGMLQRLGMAGALLGDPHILLLDEPVNGLDPEGIRWIRELLRGFAKQGRTVLISSHLLSELALSADHLVVMGRGRLLADLPMSEVVASGSPDVRVVTPQASLLARALEAPGATVRLTGQDTLLVRGVPPEEIARIAVQTRALVHELAPVRHPLEEAFLRLTSADREFTTVAGEPTSHHTHQEVVT